MRILNKRNLARYFTFSVEGLPGAVIELPGNPLPPDGDRAIEVGPDQTRELRLLVTDRNHRAGTSTPITITITDRNTGESSRASDYFHGP